LRKAYKVTNYSALYGVRPKKLSRAANISVKEATKLLEAFWNRNWAVEKVAKDCYVRNIDGKMWLLNPVSGFYHSLRYDKDRFSTLNQSTGTYCFDRWLALCRQNGVVVVFQAHDEKGSFVKIGDEEGHEALLKRCMETLNKQLKLNVPLGIDVQFGQNYAETH
jgi:DNA polymerase I-like protein with 3'-5' exonuclease and polymerase domains